MDFDRSRTRVPFSKPTISERELRYVADALRSGRLAGDGPFTARVVAVLEQDFAPGRALLVHSCTAALEMAALLADIGPGDEVIMPSFTFVSTANAFALRGAVPVFVDIRPDTFNIDETLIEAAITKRTRAVVPVHYAGVACAMDEIVALAREARILVIEDAAQGKDATYKGRPLGTHGALSAFSFHETKNLTSGEGGALLINDPALFARARVIRDKGTDRAAFRDGSVDKYSWIDLGSSYLPSELTAALMLAQLERRAEIKAARAALWQAYHEGCARLEARGIARRPVIPNDCGTNFHLYPLLFASKAARDGALRRLGEAGIDATFHYVPLHSSPAGRRLCRTSGSLAVTDRVADCILRLPLFPCLELGQVGEILAVLDGL